MRRARRAGLRVSSSSPGQGRRRSPGHPRTVRREPDRRGGQPMNRRGSASLMVLSLLLFLSAMFLGGGGVHRAVRPGPRARAGSASRRRARLRAAAEATVSGLLSDPTPFADSPSDPVWEILRAPRGDGISVTLEDAVQPAGAELDPQGSARGLGALLPGRSAQEVQEFRESAGLRLNLDTGLRRVRDGRGARAAVHALRVVQHQHHRRVRAARGAPVARPRPGRGRAVPPRGAAGAHRAPRDRPGGARGLPRRGRPTSAVPGGERGAGHEHPLRTRWGARHPLDPLRHRAVRGAVTPATPDGAGR